MHDRFRRAATEGLEIRRQRDEEAQRRTLEMFWAAVAEAEQWVHDDFGLPALIKDSVARGYETIFLNPIVAMYARSSAAGHPMWEYYLQQVLTAGIRVEQEHQDPNTTIHKIPIAQFLEDAS